jgi:hypothetical protein
MHVEARGKPVWHCRFLQKGGLGHLTELRHLLTGLGYSDCWNICIGVSDINVCALWKSQLSKVYFSLINLLYSAFTGPMHAACAALSQC